MCTNSEQIILTAGDLNNYLTLEDWEDINTLNGLYKPALDIFKNFEAKQNTNESAEVQEQLISLYNTIGDYMQEVSLRHENINIYSFKLPKPNQSEASRLIAKLRSIHTPQREFLYYIQRAYEILFNFAFHQSDTNKKHYLTVKTPVQEPVQNFAIHKIPNLDKKIENTVMCVMLRGSLLPSMIFSKEIQEYSSTAYVTPFALFRIQRDESKSEHNMQYKLNLKSSYFDPDVMHGKDLVFADPMNATGGSLVTIINYLDKLGVEPRSVLFFNVISSIKGSLQIIRAIKNVQIYTLWMDPYLNKKAYILPGLGDAGDRLNGKDELGKSRDIIQLIADYGSGITDLYRSQVREIEKTVLG